MDALFVLGWCRQMSWSFAIIVSLVAASAQLQPAPAQSAEELARILSRMDQTAANFHTTQATFVWDQYQKVVDETDTQKGTVYFRRSGDEVQMAADISDPAPPKYVLFTDSKVEVYQPKIDTVTRYNTGKERSAF